MNKMATHCTSSSDYRWPMTDIDRVKRYLHLGCESGTYYGDSARQPPCGKSDSLEKLIQTDQGKELISILSTFGRDHFLLQKELVLLSYVQCARHPCVALRQAAYSQFDNIIQTSQDLLHFVALVNSYDLIQGTGWGRSLRRAVTNWFNNKDSLHLAHMTTQQRRIMKKRWDHRDVLRLAHVKPMKIGTAIVLKYLVKGLVETPIASSDDSQEDKLKELQKFLEAVEEVGKCEDEQRVAAIVGEHKLLLGHLNPKWLKSNEVWSMLVQHLPLKEILFNLGKLTYQGLFNANGGEAVKLCERLNRDEQINAAKLHPYDLLQSLKSYRAKKSGRQEKGKFKWIPNKDILEALESALIRSFKFIQPTGKKFLLAIDVSSSMKLSGVNGSPGVTAMEAVAILTMQIVRAEKEFRVMAFSDTLENINISPEMTLEETKAKIGELPMGSTNVSYPLKWASENKVPVEIFMIFTDCETSFEETPPSQALREYRKEMNLDAKLVVIAFASNGFQVADPSDGGMLDIAGFNTSGPEVIRRFATGEL